MPDLRDLLEDQKLLQSELKDLQACRNAVDEELANASDALDKLLGALGGKTDELLQQLIGRDLLGNELLQLREVERMVTGAIDDALKELADVAKNEAKALLNKEGVQNILSFLQKGQAALEQATKAVSSAVSAATAAIEKFKSLLSRAEQGVDEIKNEKDDVLKAIMAIELVLELVEKLLDALIALIAALLVALAAASFLFGIGVAPIVAALKKASATLLLTKEKVGLLRLKIRLMRVAFTGLTQGWQKAIELAKGLTKDLAMKVADEIGLGDELKKLQKDITDKVQEIAKQTGIMDVVNSTLDGLNGLKKGLEATVAASNENLAGIIADVSRTVGCLPQVLIIVSNADFAFCRRETLTRQKKLSAN
ncbi:hypothetical protein DFJ74DRAFT_474807 [Hyaloraphidium curvatum]|nr:hypothetical protein DFJ74DRAFT_474807 [Hyaloraphidium curvatum]